MFDKFMTDQLTILGQNGNIQEVKGKVGTDTILIRDVNIQVKEGDTIKRTNLAGIEEVYHVTNVFYNDSPTVKALRSISISYKKEGSIKDQTPSYYLVNSNLAIHSPNSSLGNAIKIHIEDLKISDPEVLELVKELQNELAKDVKNESILKSIFNKIMDKAPDLLLNLIARIIAG